MHLRLAFALAVFAGTALASAQPAALSTPAVETPQDRPQITYADGLILGVVEGVTEYLPVSSTGHLIIANELLGLESEAVLRDRDGTIVLHKDHGEIRPMTLKDAADAYAIIIQFGAILAVMILYWKRLWYVLMGALGRNPQGLKLLINLIIAFLPAAVLGLLLRGFIETHLFGPMPVAVALIFGTVLMFVIEYWRKRNCPPPQEEYGPDLPDLSPKSALLIGLLQCVAMWPGTSRSMMTLVGGYLAGLNPRRAAEFSFLLGFVTLSAASLYKLYKNGPAIAQALDIGPLILGLFVATVSAALAVKWMVGYLTRHGLNLFAWYRLALAAAVILTFWH